MITKISASAGAGKTHTLTQCFLGYLHLADPHKMDGGCALLQSPQAYSLGEIIAATFTNKAAAEMKSRIISTLKEQALSQNPQESKRASIWLEKILRDYNSLNIRTIDSLLAGLVRLSALPLNISPDFTPSFQSEEYFSPVYDALMQDLREDRAASAVFYTSTAKTLVKALEKSCKTLVNYGMTKGFSDKGKSDHSILHDQILILVERMLLDRPIPETSTGEIESLLLKLHQKTVQKILKLLELLDKEGLAVNQNFLKFLQKRSLMDAFSQQNSSVFDTNDDLDSCLNKASKTLASAETQKTFEDMRKSYSLFSSARPLLVSSLGLAPLVLLAREVYARMQAGQQNNIPSICLPKLASRALQGEFGASDAMCRLGAKLRHILLDEFQDTSREQWASLLPLIEESLSTGGSLTYVGDVKQAIYSWRGGDAKLFSEVEMEPSLLNIVPNPQSMPLSENWRSAPAIIDFNNTFFAQLANKNTACCVLEAMLPKSTPQEYINLAAAQAVQVFAEVAQKFPSAKVQNQESTTPQAVKLYIVDGDTSGSVEDMVKNRLYSLCQQDLFPRLAYNQVALLVRSKKQASTLAQWFASWGYPVVTENSLLLAGHPLISRLTAFLQFLDYPLDDSAFWEFITGEECFLAVSKLGKKQLEDWLAGLRAENKNLPLYVLFQKDFPELWLKWIAPFFNQAGLMSAYDTLFESINHFGLLKTESNSAPFLRRFLEITHLAERRGASSLASFLALWSTLQNDEKLPLPESMNAIRIMTMHSAKGLAFDVVIAPFHHDSTHQDEEIITTEILGLPILARRMAEIPEEFYPACTTRAIEALNLLYVSWTRPKHELHAFITRAKSRKSSPLVNALDVLLDGFCQEHEKKLFYLEKITQQTLAEDIEQDFCVQKQVACEHSSSLEPSSSLEQNSKLEQNASFEQSSSPLQGSTPQEQFEVKPVKYAGQASLFTSLEKTPPKPAWRPMDWLPKLKIYRSSLHKDEPITYSKGQDLQEQASALAGASTSVGASTGVGASVQKHELQPKQKGILAHLCLEHLVFSKQTLAASGHERTTLLANDVSLAVRIGLGLFPLPIASPKKVEQDMQKSLLWFASLPQATEWLANGLREQSVMDKQGEIHRVDLLVNSENHELLAIDYKTGGKNRQHHEQVLRYINILAKAQHLPVQGKLVYLDLECIEDVKL